MRTYLALGFAAGACAIGACGEDEARRPSVGFSGPDASSSASSSAGGEGGAGGAGGASTHSTGGGDGGAGGQGVGGGAGGPPAPYCGDLTVNPGEECDDGNTSPGDGCAGDCMIESGEVEPNNTAVTASPLVKSPYYAKIDPAGDVDYVAFTVVGPGASVTARTMDVGDGACAVGDLDSFLEILAADGTTVLGGDEDGGEGYCSRVVLPNLGAGNFFARISASPKAATPTFIYRLRIDQVMDVCGDNNKTVGEECDDGNMDAGDGCSPTCTLEISESEPNDAVASADAFVDPWNAVLTPAADVDVVSVTLANAVSSLTATTTDQGTGACAAKTLDTIVEILAPNGTTVLASGDDIVGNCGSALAPNLAAGTYFVRIKGGSLVTDPSPYGLQIIVQ